MLQRHFKVANEALGRFLKKPLGLLTIVSFIIAVNLWDPLLDYMHGKSSREAINEAWWNLHHFVDNPLIRIVFALITFWLIGHATAKLIEADDARARELDANRAADIEKIKTTLDELVRESMEGPRILARQARLQARIEQENEVLTRSKDTLHFYRAQLDQMRGGFRMGAYEASGRVRESLHSTVSVLHELGTILREPLELRGLAEPNPVINDNPSEEELRFAPDENAEFFAAHENNARLLQLEIERLQGVIGKANAESRRLEQQLQAHLAKYDEES